MKLVVVDPIGNNAASKADEWLPIRPGTDAAFGLGMLNVLLNEARIFDADYLKHFTNATYLTAASGKFVRDPATGKPFVFDQSDGRVKVFDDAGVKEPMLEGETEVQGQKVRPAFELIKARAAEYSAERVEEITTIPAKL
jgi:anaerobic selenocysteine-containing dehydrogenase